jgi:hypothetical protein
MNQVELKLLRRQTREFIHAKGIKLRLKRQGTVDSGNGAWIPGAVETLLPQEFRLVPFKRRLTLQEVKNQDGAFHVLDYILVGFHDADVQRGDKFTYLDTDYEVIGVEPGADDRSTCDRVTCQLELRKHDG